MSRNDELNSRAEQIADAKEEGREEIIRCMADSGMTVEEISKIVNRDVKDVESILRSQHP